MRRPIAIGVVCTTILLAAVSASMTPKSDPRLKGAFRRPAVNAWTLVHLEGTPSEIGYQHGYLLAPEIQDLYKERRQYQFDINYSVQTKRVGTEILIASKGLILPSNLTDRLVNIPESRAA